MIIPATQKAAVLRGAYGEYHTIDTKFTVPQLGPEEALVRLEASGICHGDVNPRDGYPPAPPEPVRPLVAGHEGIGQVVALGESVTGFKIGDVVGIGWRHATCLSCKQCKQGYSNLCPSVVLNGYTQDGTFQEYMKARVSGLVHIPRNDVPAYKLAPLLCAGGTALGAVRSSGVREGDWLCVPGAAGGVGSLAVRYAKHFGLKVVAIDSKRKELHCKNVGADLFVDYEDGNTVVTRIAAGTGGGVQGTVVCAANPTSYSQAVEYSAIGATIVSVGPSMVHLHTGPLMVKDIKLMARCNGTKKDIDDALALGGEGILPDVDIVPLERIDEALDKLKQGNATGRQVILFQ